MPTAEDRLFADRLANVLRELRRVAGWNQERAAEEIGTSVSTLSRWERGISAPKGYDLGRVYRAYEPFGADWREFLDPPEVVVKNPVRDRLAELARDATRLALEDSAAESAPDQPDDDGPRSPRRKRPT